MPRKYLWAVAVLLLILAPAALGQDVAPPATPEIDTGTTAWMLTSTALVLLMVPGLALFYGGLVRTKNVLGTMMHSFVAMAIIGVSWAVVGYGMCFGDSQLGGIIGWSPEYLLLAGLDTEAGQYTTINEAGTLAIPSFVFAMFQGKFAIIAPALIAGAFAERVKFRGYCLFILLWSLLVYCPLCHMIWGGGLVSGKAIDLAGGTVIHIAAGTAGLVCALILGSRRGYPRTAMHPNNLVLTLLGAGLLWVGWFGFNSGSFVQSNLDTGRALAMTQIAAAAAALTWVLIESLHLKKATSLGMASGIIAGLVAITPAAGAVTTMGALVLGAMGSVGAYGAIMIKNKLGYDDTLDVFGIHGVAGIIGAIGLMFFLRESAASWATQMWHQIEGVLLAIGVSGIMTAIIAIAIDKTLGLKLSDQEQRAGMDHELHGEHGYGLLNLN
ncbi:ammonium transporter [Phycisphaeraceae bacterium D3-23]